MPRAEDLDQLFPWLLASTALLGSLLLLFIIVLQPEKFLSNMLKAQDSRVEITLAPLPQHNQINPVAAIHSLTNGPKLRNGKRNPETIPDIVRKRELAAYLLLWQNHILAIAKAQIPQKRLPIGKVVVAVTLSASGKLLSIDVLQGAQNHVLLLAVKEMLLAASPFPPLPSAWQNPPQNLRIIRTWNFD